MAGSAKEVEAMSDEHSSDDAAKTQAEPPLRERVKSIETRMSVLEVENGRRGVRVSRWLGECCFVLGMAAFLVVCISLLVGR